MKSLSSSNLSFSMMNKGFWNNGLILNPHTFIHSISRTLCSLGYFSLKGNIPFVSQMIRFDL